VAGNSKHSWNVERDEFRGWSSTGNGNRDEVSSSMGKGKQSGNIERNEFRTCSSIKHSDRGEVGSSDGVGRGISNGVGKGIFNGDGISNGGGSSSRDRRYAVGAFHRVVSKHGRIIMGRLLCPAVRTHVAMARRR
jgi:hypothetical protein